MMNLFINNLISFYILRYNKSYIYDGVGEVRTSGSNYLIISSQYVLCSFPINNNLPIYKIQ